MEQNKWIDISNAFNPMDPVPPNKLHEWFVVRPDSPIELLVNKLSPKRLPERYILVGQPASGKSSELTKLAAELENRYKDTLIVRFDIAVITDILEANPVEVIFLMGASVFKAAKESKLNPDKQLLENLTQGLETIVKTYSDNKDFKINLEKLLKGLIVYTARLIGVPTEVTDYFKGYFRFTSGIDIKKLRTREIDPTVEPMLQSLNDILEDIRKKSGGNPPVLLVDGLDKLRNPDTIKLMFVEKQFLNRPNCNVVYIGPLDLYYSAEVGARLSFNIVPYANIKIFSRDNFDKLDEVGKKIMTEVVSNRLKTLKLTIAEVITDDALETLIRGSGGVMRDFIRLIQDAATYAEINEKKRITNEEAKRVLNELRRMLKAQITPKYQKVLDQVRKNQDRTDDKECDVLLRNNIVLIYANDANSNGFCVLIEEKRSKSEFDVFLCHNSNDKPFVKDIANKLKEKRILSWLDEWELQPGLPWQEALEMQIEKIRSVAIFIGETNIGPWQNMEMKAFLQEFVDRRCPVIPVILPACQSPPDLPVFLRGMTWVDFRKNEPNPMEQLVWGITGKRSADNDLKDTKIVRMSNDDIWYYVHSALSEKPW